MLRLKNIKITDKTAEADFYPENLDLYGHIVVDLASREIVDIRHVPGYEFMYPGHARKELVRIAKAGETRETSVVMWY